VITVGSGLYAAAEAIIATVVAGGAAAGTASATAEGVRELADHGIDWVGDQVDVARDLVRKSILQDGTDLAKSAAEQLAGHREFQTLPASVQGRLIQNVTNHVRRRALEALGEHLQRVIEHTDAGQVTHLHEPACQLDILG